VTVVVVVAMAKPVVDTSLRPWATPSWWWSASVLLRDGADAAETSQVEFSRSLSLQLQRKTIARQLLYQRHAAASAIAAAAAAADAVSY